MPLHSAPFSKTLAPKDKLLILVAALCLSQFCAPGHDPMIDEAATLGELGEIRLGDLDSDIAKKIKPLWFPRDKCDFLLKHPFNALVPYTNVTVKTEWQATKDPSDGRPLVLFAVFSDANKTNLVNVLWGSGLSINPVVAGVFDKNLKCVKAGDSIAHAFQLLGRRDCKYLQSADGKWRIKVSYPTAEQGEREIEADAGSDKVLKVTDWKSFSASGLAVPHKR